MMNALQAGPPQWFERNGTPVCEGDSQTSVSVAQARRQGLLPSVDNVLGVIARPAVDQSAEAAARTTQICAHIRRGADRAFRGLDVGPEDPAVQWLGFLREWLAENCREVRWIGQTAIHQLLGYGATPWMLIDHRSYGLTLVDLKTQGPRHGMGASTYRLWGYEMAAWQMALRARNGIASFRCLTLVMNSQEPHPPVEAVWSEEHLAKCKSAFLAARQLWVIENGYDPRRVRSAAP